jgi:hypothetical protein
MTSWESAPQPNIVGNDLNDVADQLIICQKRSLSTEQLPCTASATLERSGLMSDLDRIGCRAVRAGAGASTLFTGSRPNALKLESTEQS